MTTLETIGNALLVTALTVVGGLYYADRLRRGMDSVKTDASERAVRRSRKFWGKGD
jgi:hypothetical protein